MRSRSSLALVVVAVLGLTACGGTSDSTSGDAGTASSAGQADNTEHAMGMDSGDEHDFAFGEAADAADADRTIEVTAKDSLAYDPSSITVADGETVTFEVTNTGQIVHEFVLGPEAYQQEHEQEMAQMRESGGAMEHHDPNALTIEPGQTASLTWHFTGDETIQFACHEPGHYAGGMVGDLTVGS